MQGGVVTEEFNPTKSMARLFDEAAKAFRKALSSQGLKTATVKQKMDAVKELCEFLLTGRVRRR